MENLNKNKKMAIFTMFTCLVVVLQVIATYINFGGFPISLTLIPIIVGGALFGASFGSYLGLVFGIVVLLMTITALDPNAFVMFGQHPFVTSFICLFKGLMSGFISSLAYKNIPNKKIAIFVSSALAPLTNTSLFCVVLVLFFNGTFATAMGILLSINFLIEFLTNIILGPTVFNIVSKKINYFE